MSIKKPPFIDQLSEIDDETVELFILQYEDWESDPLLVKNLRDKIKACKNYISTNEFRSLFPQQQAKIVLQVAHMPPNEIYQILAKEGLEIRKKSSPKTPPKKKHKIDRIRNLKNGTVELIIDQPIDWESDPLLVKNLRDKIKAYQKFASTDLYKQRYPQTQAQIILETPHNPPPDLLDLFKKEGVTLRIQKPSPSSPSSQNKSTSKKVDLPADASLEEMQRHIRQKAHIDDDLLDDNILPSETFSSTTLTLKILLALSILALVYSIYAISSAPKVPDMPETITPAQISPQTMHNHYVTLSITPKWFSFIPIPIQEKRTTKRSLFVLFAAKETNKLLIFSPREQSQIIENVEVITPDLSYPENTKLKVTWAKDLNGKTTPPKTRTYTGTLVKAQLRHNGPLEIVLPDGHRDINKIYTPMGLSFPKDSMILRVGEKPQPPSLTIPYAILLFSIIFSMIFGGILLFSEKK